MTADFEKLREWLKAGKLWRGLANSHRAIHSRREADMGIFVVGFGLPVVPEGHARLRIQMSAAHTDEQIEWSLDAFETLRPRAWRRVS